MSVLMNILKLFIRPMKNLRVDNPKKILVFKPGAIGDILWTTPFLRQLRKKYPSAEIVYCVGKWSSEALENNPNIDRLIVIDESRLMRKDLLYALKTIKGLRKEKFDIAFAFEKHYLSNLLVFATGIKIKVGFDRFGEGFPLNIAVPYGNDKHEIEYDLDLLSAAENKPAGKTKKEYESRFGKDYWRTQVYPKKEEIKKIDDLFKRNKIKGKIVGIAPGGSKNTGEWSMIRRWPVERYVKLSEALLKKRFKVVIFGGVTDIDIAKRFDKRCVNLIGMLNVRESVCAMGKCDYFICNDAGPMNMAAASGSKRLKIISLFGPTRPDRKAPMNPGSTPIWKDADIYYPEYDLYGRIRQVVRGFMDRISVDDVLKKIK